MSIKAVLFDLDGTLLPMDQDIFVKAYFKGLTTKLAPFGFNPENLIKAIWGGTEAMIKNDGGATNEEVFWNFFAKIFGEEVRGFEPTFEEFYKNEFSAVKNICGYNEKSKEVIELLKEKGINVALATNPIFPKIATKARISWAGLEEKDFSLITTYENSKYSKPNPKYYLEIINALGVKPEDCLMVGNDIGDDMVAEALGLKVFLLTDNLINKTDKKVSDFENGNFDSLITYLKKVTD